MINQKIVKRISMLKLITREYSKECLARKGFEHQSHHRGKFAIYLKIKRY